MPNTKDLFNQTGEQLNHLSTLLLLINVRYGTGAITEQQVQAMLSICEIPLKHAITLVEQVNERHTNQKVHSLINQLNGIQFTFKELSEFDLYKEQTSICIDALVQITETLAQEYINY